MSIVRVDSSVLNVPDSMTKTVLFGPKMIQSLKIAFDSSTNSGVNLNNQFPPKCIVTNDWYLSYSLTLQVTAPIGAVPVGTSLFAGWGSTMAPRNFPLLWAMTSITLRINDQVITCQIKDLMPYISKCMSNEDALEYADVGPALPDQGFFSYATAVGTSKNVLGSYADSRENWIPRGNWSYDKIGTALGPDGSPDGVAPLGVAGAATVGFVKFSAVTPLLIPPLANKAIGVPVTSMANIYNVNINGVFDGTFAKCLSVPATWTANATNVPNVFGNAGGSNVNLLMVSSYAPETQPIPPEVRMPNIVYDIKSQSINKVGPYIAGADAPQVQIASNMYQYDSYPDAFIIYCHKRMANQIASDSDSFLPFKEGFSITINGNNSLLNGNTNSQNYQITKKYARQDFAEFSGYVNAVIGGASQRVATSGPIYIFKPAVDLVIGELAAPNMVGYRIQMQFNNLFVQNNTTTTFGDGDLELVVISLRSGELTLTPSSGSQSSSIINQADVVAALSKEPMYTGEVETLEGQQTTGGRSGGKMRLTSVSSRRGGAPSGGARSAGMISVGVAVPRTHTSRF